MYSSKKLCVIFLCALTLSALGGPGTSKSWHLTLDSKLQQTRANLSMPGRQVPTVDASHNASKRLMKNIGNGSSISLTSSEITIYKTST